MDGLNNEYEFVKYFNRKKVKELDHNSRDLIEYLFKEIDENSIITCWRNHYRQKADIFIKANGIMKGISIKKGSRNSVHVEGISYFRNFLHEIGIPINIINLYCRYHFADGSLNGSGNIRMSADEYKKTHEKEIEKINEYFNNPQIIKKAIDRFVLKGNNSDFFVDAIIYGEYNDFLWLKKEDVYNSILNQKDSNCSAIHFGSLVVQPKARCLNYNKKYEQDRFCVQIKWYSLFDDIIKNMVIAAKLLT